MSRKSDSFVLTNKLVSMTKPVDNLGWRFNWSKVTVALSLVTILALAVAMRLHLADDLERLRLEAFQSPWAWVGLAMIVLSFLVLVWRIFLVVGYRSTPSCPDKDLPLCTVVIPAYNEGRQVLDTVRSVMASDYPWTRMQVVCVDDGSRDDTWIWMQAAAREFPDRLELVRQPINHGKRRALYEGFVRARGEILVTIDSDSEVAPGTIRSLASVMVRNGRVGAVAGNVRVLNVGEGLIPKMLDVSFTFSFDFIRASQSRVNTVMCTPGALSGYRRSAVVPILDEWLNQTFLGREANIGEDRAMTNLILRQGWLVHFQHDAVVYTKVPTAYRGLCKMLLRWARSNIRETLALCRFAFKRFRPEGATGARINLLVHLLRMSVGECFKLSLPLVLMIWPLLAGYNLLIGLVTAALVPALFHFVRNRNTDFLWAFPYAAFWLVGLSWISLYALVTPHRNGWLTRDLATELGEVAQSKMAVNTARIAA
ncbi:MAG: glycosyltransferase family 2 protein [Deltaproteobacteria bacterium]|nr:glycosyltransferase family 2 protein [Deltaproteobacteria bacterium]